MTKKRVTLTREGREKLCAELEYLKNEKRREIAKALAEARAHGDLSENAEYDAAKEAQAMNEKKIAQLEDTLIGARIIDDKAVPKDQALLGATVKVKHQTNGEEYDYMLVSEEEADLDENKISVSSPVGKAMLGHKVGDTVRIQVPAGEVLYKITEIRR